MKKRWQYLANVESLAVTSTALQILSIIPDLFEQNSQLVEVNNITDYPDDFNLKLVEGSIKSGKIIKYSSQFATSVSFTAPAFVAGTASAAAPVSVPAPASAAAPSNLHICPADKDDKSSNEDKCCTIGVIELDLQCAITCDTRGLLENMREMLALVWKMAESCLG
ncbi:hypothetical protein P8452_33178 [Trifolium repens]|nr:hypothetical protein P8452_33178 [Trifolium repens]